MDHLQQDTLEQVIASPRITFSDLGVWTIITCEVTVSTLSLVLQVLNTLQVERVAVVEDLPLIVPGCL